MFKCRSSGKAQLVYPERTNDLDSISAKQGRKSRKRKRKACGKKSGGSWFREGSLLITTRTQARELPPDWVPQGPGSPRHDDNCQRHRQEHRSEVGTQAKPKSTENAARGRRVAAEPHCHPRVDGLWNQGKPSSDSFQLSTWPGHCSTRRLPPHLA